MNLLSVKIRRATLHPNPFNPETSVNFDLGFEQHIRVVVYDLRGRRVLTLIEELRDAGPQQIGWNGRDDRGPPMFRGAYVVEIVTEARSENQKWVLVK